MDNMAVVNVLKATYCRDLHLMLLIRILISLAAFFKFWFVANHIVSKDNYINVCNLSRNNLDNLFSQVPKQDTIILTVYQILS